MGASTNVVGFKPADEKWKKMKAVWDSCEKANICIPTSVVEFFNGDTPDSSGVLIELLKHPCCEKYSAEMKDGYEIDVSKLPKDVKIIRVYTSY